MKHKWVMQKFLQTLFDITLLHPLDPYILIKLGDIQRTCLHADSSLAAKRLPAETDVYVLSVACQSIW